jgi:cation:H+ antiporter
MIIYSSWALGSLFIVCALLIWVFGIKLSKAIDEIVNHYGWGEAIGGIVFLAIITNLPEIAITAVAAFKHDYDIAVSNILGGIAIQTAVLVLIDIYGVGRKAPLTLKGHSKILLFEGLTVIIILSLVIAANKFPTYHYLRHTTAFEWMILFTWLLSIWGIKRLYQLNQIKKVSKHQTNSIVLSTVKVKKAIFVTILGAIITLVAGYGLEVSGEILSKRWGMDGVVFGATILALCTALPEISTGIASAKIRDYQMAVSDIFGGNAFLPVLFLMAALIGGESILPGLKVSDIYLTSIGILLTTIYMIGMLFHSKKQFFRMGIDSIIVLVLYLASIVGLVYINN